MAKAQYAYAIWPWGLEKKEQMIQALKDVKEIGYVAFESVESAVDLFAGQVDEFKSIIEEFGVRPASFYFWLTGKAEDDIGRVKDKIGFLAANDVHRMSVQGPKWTGKPATQGELENTLHIIGEIGKIARDHDVIPCVHPHHGTMIMYESEIDFIMGNTDPGSIAFAPDTAHLAAGGCDPVAICERYKERIRFTHLKDLKTDTGLQGDDGSERGFAVYDNFRELGEGDVDFSGVFDVLRSVEYEGYLTPELDRSRYTNKKSAEINMAYLRKHYPV